MDIIRKLLAAGILLIVIILISYMDYDAISDSSNEVQAVYWEMIVDWENAGDVSVYDHSRGIWMTPDSDTTSPVPTRETLESSVTIIRL